MVKAIVRTRRYLTISKHIISEISFILWYNTLNEIHPPKENLDYDQKPMVRDNLIKEDQAR